MLTVGLAKFLSVISTLNTLEFRAFQNGQQLKSLNPSSLFSVINLDLPGLKDVRKTLEAGSYDEALDALLNYYLKKYTKLTQIEDNMS